MIEEMLIFMDRTIQNTLTGSGHMSKKRKRREQQRNQKKLITLILTSSLCLIALVLYCFACSRLDDENI